MTRGRLIFWVSALAITSFYGTNPSIAQNVCDINGRSIEYMTRACVNNNCSDIHQRITFLGNKELLHYYANASAGITFYDGRTVDLNTDELQEEFKADVPPGMIETATATSIRRNLDFYLTQHRLFRSVTGQPIANYWHEVGVRILDCNRCELILYRMRGNYGEHNVISTFEQPSCRFLP